MLSSLITLSDIVLNKGSKFLGQLELAAVQCRMMLRVTECISVHKISLDIWPYTVFLENNRQTSLVPGFEALLLIAAPAPAEC